MLNPASNSGALFTSPYDKINGYDTDLSNGYVLDKKGGSADPIKRLDLGAATSRSFNGITSVAGNEAQAGTAKESFLVDFGTASTNQHEGVVTAYTNLARTDANGNSRLVNNILGLNDTQSDHQFRPDFFKGGSLNSKKVHEGVIPVDADSNPLFLVAAKLNGGTDDRFIYATNTNDELVENGVFAKYYNTNGNNSYYAGNGDDLVVAGTGNDTLFSGAGNDRIDGKEGNNLIFGDDGNDSLRSGIGNDTLFSGVGNDSIDSGNGANLIFGDDGNDSLGSGIGNDGIYGEEGNDTIYSGAGNDTLDGGSGNNFIDGEEGDDILSAGTGNDTSYGGAGNDTIDGGNGNNFILGADGNDIINASTGNDTIYGGGGHDTIDAGNGTNNIYGSEGNDYLAGGSGLNRFFGGSGNDILLGGTGHNLFKGTESNTMSNNEVDTLTGSSSASQNSFYIGDTVRNWYSSNGTDDFAHIFNFDFDRDVIIGGVNIEAQNVITLNLVRQTYLWSGDELIAKIEGYWADKLSFEFPTRTPSIPWPF